MYNLYTIVPHYTHFKACICQFPSLFLVSSYSLVKKLISVNAERREQAQAGTLGPWGSRGKGRRRPGSQGSPTPPGAREAWTGRALLERRGRGGGGRCGSESRGAVLSLRGPGAGAEVGALVGGARSHCLPGLTPPHPGPYYTRSSAPVYSRAPSLNSPSLSTTPHHLRTSRSASGP